MSNAGSYSDWFIELTGHADGPRSWQKTLAEESECRNRLIRIGTGLGKTEGVLATWMWHCIAQSNVAWPRRLVWCLPMRVLVEQTVGVAERLAERLAQRLSEDRRPAVHVTMGGEDAGEWYIYPERPAVIIGTQDMLLSRALNRGFGGSRARWPIEFGLLSQDALWVMDEVQLMDVGLATSAQIQAFRGHDELKGLRPVATWWMSATLQPEWLKSVDTAEQHSAWIRNPSHVPPTQRSGGLWDVKKSLAVAEIERGSTKAFAERILREHAGTPEGDHGRITLVVCNTVRRACETFDALRALGRKEGLQLVHSQFRPIEREEWRERFLSRAACAAGVDRIIVATQVVEAGVDISAGCLISELAPWPSLVQRFGRCARYGGAGRVLIVNRGHDEKSSPPYASTELESAWETLQQLTDAGLATLEHHEESLSTESRSRLFPYAPPQLLLRREYDELFDTTPDLTGADIDISRFIRTGDERDLQVFWLNLPHNATPPSNRQPHRRELCAVPFLQARDWLCGEETSTNRKPKLRAAMRAWVWDWLDGDWVIANRASLLPGRIVCVAAECGGYRTERGFDPSAPGPVAVLPSIEGPSAAEALSRSDRQQDGESLSVNGWKTIACHSMEVATLVEELAVAIGLPEPLRHVLYLAAQWHDVGKSHPAFQGKLQETKSCRRPDRNDLAKGPDEVWIKPAGLYRFRGGSEERPAFRHELASALALFSVLRQFAPSHPALLGPWKEILTSLGHVVDRTDLPTPPAVLRPILECTAEAFDLLVYLVASHHGKVRVALHAAPKDQDYHDRDGHGLPIRGVREADTLPAIPLTPGGELLPELTLTLAPAALGLSFQTGASWRERSTGLVDRFGPASLAFLESILRAADARASRLTTADPELTV
jgi:CRISPR-associated endonuclease/helicase Cas3